MDNHEELVIAHQNTDSAEKQTRVRNNVLIFSTDLPEACRDCKETPLIFETYSKKHKYVWKHTWKKERLASTYHVVLLSSETACPYSFFARETRAVTNFRRSRLLSNMLIKRRTRKGYVLVKPRIRKGMWHTQRLCATLAAYPQWLCGTETAYMQQSATGMCYSSR